MYVVMPIIPGAGHLHPFLPLARALGAAGHRVEFATTASFADAVAQHGFTSIPVRPDYTQSGLGATDPAAFVELLVEFMLDGQHRVLEDLGTAFGSDRPDVVITDPNMLGAPVAAEAAGLPFGMLNVHTPEPSYPGMLPFDVDERRRWVDRYHEGTYERLRADAGLPPAGLEPKIEAPWDRSLRLEMTPPGLLDWPLRAVSHVAHPLRPELHATPDAPAEWLEQLPGDRPVVGVTLGSLVAAAPLYEAAIEAVLANGAAALVATGLELHAGDAHVVTTPWASMDTFMARVDAVVHHGGFGSTMNGAIAGKPAVATPFMSGDQWTNGLRIEAAGAGRFVRPDDRADGLRAALGSVLTDPVYALNAQRIARGVVDMPAAGEVVPLVERLAEDGPPILNH